MNLQNPYVEPFFKLILKLYLHNLVIESLKKRIRRIFFGIFDHKEGSMSLQNVCSSQKKTLIQKISFVLIGFEKRKNLHMS